MIYVSIWGGFGALFGGGAEPIKAYPWRRDCIRPFRDQAVANSAFGSKSLATTGLSDARVNTSVVHFSLRSDSDLKIRRKLRSDTSTFFFAKPIITPWVEAAMLRVPRLSSAQRSLHLLKVKYAIK